LKEKKILWQWNCRKLERERAREREREREAIRFLQCKKRKLPKSMQNSYIDSYSKKQKEIHRFLFLPNKTYYA